MLGSASNNSVVVLKRDGTIAQKIPLEFGSGPDGIAFHTSPPFVLTNNNDGSITRFDFPGNDLTQKPTQSVFASGGFRGDMTQVGPDGDVLTSHSREPATATAHGRERTA